MESRSMRYSVVIPIFSRRVSTDNSRIMTAASAELAVARESARALRVRVALLSVAALIPCFWQRRIQAGDLSSHIYNSWLAQQIDLGRAPGLTIVPVTTNVLFDLTLSWLFRSFGAEAAQRIAVSLVVLIFFWGAFALVSATSKTPPWFLV